MLGGDLSLRAAVGPWSYNPRLCSPLSFAAAANTLLLFLLFYECLRPEERDSTDFLESDNISRKESKEHFTNHPLGPNQKQQDCTASAAVRGATTPGLCRPVRCCRFRIWRKLHIMDNTIVWKTGRRWAEYSEIFSEMQQPTGKLLSNVIKGEFSTLSHVTSSFWQGEVKHTLNQQMSCAKS